jgi:hypothetical protein
MTNTAHTLFSLTLFLALAALNMWSTWRQRFPRMVRGSALPQSGQ